MQKFTIFILLIATFYLACSSSSDRVNDKAASSNLRSGLVADGAAVFKKYCVLCHGADGKLGTNGAKDLSTSVLDKAQRIEMIKKGKGLMTPFQEILSEEEIEAVADYTFTFKSK